MTKPPFDPNLSPATTEELIRLAAEARATISPHIDRATTAFLAYERAATTHAHRLAKADRLREAGYPVELTAKETKELEEARARLFELVTHPLLVGAMPPEVTKLEAEIAYLRETCTRQQIENETLRTKLTEANRDRAELERRVLAKE